MTNLKYIEKINQNEGFSIETGYFIFTLMPSLRCSLNCPHCYLSLDQRRNSDIMKIEDLEIACKKVLSYYEKVNIKNKVLVFYWYGGEPTEMGIEYFEKAINLINSIFKIEDGYRTKHTVLTSLLTIDTKVWFPFFKKYCDNHFQSSFDGLMRGLNYTKKWELKIKEAIEYGLDVGTISVVNNELLKVGANKTMDYLANLKVKEVSFLPFMLNDQNAEKSYGKYAPTMNEWSKFMKEASLNYFDKKNNNLFSPEIGQMSFIMHQKEQELMANIAAQTLFLLPNGDFVLPDYKDGYKEYMNVFGNILESDFGSILHGKERLKYLKRQTLRNQNKECVDCEHADKCVMEFWKENKVDDDCFGGKKYINWLLDYTKENNIKFSKNVMY